MKCTLLERLNELSDKLAKSALVSAIAGGSTIKLDLPFELVKFSLSGRKVSGSPCLAREADWGYRVAEFLFDETDIIQKIRLPPCLVGRSGCCHVRLSKNVPCLAE
jgi:hypothetical protein